MSANVREYVTQNHKQNFFIVCCVCLGTEDHDKYLLCFSFG